MRIAVDLDGILTEKEEIKNWEYTVPINNVVVYAKAKPNRIIIDYINDLFFKGHEITIFTARDRYYRPVTIEWLSFHEVMYHDIIFNKLHYELLLDDRATNNIKELTRMIKCRKK